MRAAPLSGHTHEANDQLVTSCPFREGKETVDLLLAEMREGELLDATLDLRSLLQARSDAEACLGQFFRVRQLLDERHYLAFYRVRCWLRRLIAAEVRPSGRSDWTRCEVALGSARFDELVNGCLARVATEGSVPETAQVRFVFTAPTTTVGRIDTISEIA